MPRSSPPPPARTVSRTPAWRGARLTLATLLVGLGAAACGGDDSAQGAGGDAPTIVVTYSVLGAVVSELVGDAAEVKVLMGNGVDPHDWSPSAKDIEAVQGADLVVANGLGLEEGLEDVLDGLEPAKVFYATDHIEVRELSEGEEAGHSDEEHAGEEAHADEEHADEAHADEAHADEEKSAGEKTSGEEHADEEHAHEHEGGDPHFWVDPVSMSSVVTALSAELDEGLGLDLGSRTKALTDELAELDESVRTKVAAVPEADRQLVTGHESLGYFADRYGFTLVGAVVPGVSSQAESSAAQLAELKEKVRDAGVDVVFTEIGTSQAVADAVAKETGARVVELPSHNLPDDGRYVSFIDELVDKITAALAG